MEKTPLEGLLLIKPNVHEDKRGYFYENYRDELFEANGLPTNFRQDNQTKSVKGTLRGLHYQMKYPQGKLVRVSLGMVYDVAVDLRKNSKTYGKHFKIILSEKNGKHLFVPKGFAHGILGLDKENILHYACSNYRDPKREVSIKWNDTDLKISWGIKKPIISKKDKLALSLKDFKKNRK